MVKNPTNAASVTTILWNTQGLTLGRNHIHAANVIFFSRTRPILQDSQGLTLGRSHVNAACVEWIYTQVKGCIYAYIVQRDGMMAL